MEEWGQNMAAVRVRHAQLARVLGKASQFFPGVMHMHELLIQLSDHHTVTYIHSLRSARLAMAFASRLGLEMEDTDVLICSALFHDAGKIRIPVTILDKPGPLTAGEMGMIRQHPVQGAQIISAISSFPAVREAIYFHHERWDGKGYPAGLSGLNIPLVARVISIVDAFDVMTSARVYKPKAGVPWALNELQGCAGSQFDPQLVEVFMTMFKKNTERVGEHEYEPGGAGGGIPARS